VLTDQEKVRLRHVGLTALDVEELEDYEANVTMFIQCLLRLQSSSNRTRVEQGRRLLIRFEEFTATQFASPKACMKTLDDLLVDTLLHLQAMDAIGEPGSSSSQTRPRTLHSSAIFPPEQPVERPQVTEINKRSKVTILG